MTSPSLPKFPIFAQSGVPEVWRADGSQVHIFCLEGGQYVAHAESSILMGITAEVIAGFVRESDTRDRLTWLRRVRAWVRQRKRRNSSSVTVEPSGLAEPKNNSVLAKSSPKSRALTQMSPSRGTFAVLTIGVMTVVRARTNSAIPGMDHRGMQSSRMHRPSAFWLAMSPSRGSCSSLTHQYEASLVVGCGSCGGKEIW
jgi:hypothetical protein